MWSECLKALKFKLFVFIVAGAISNISVGWGLRVHDHYEINRVLATRVTGPAFCEKPQWIWTRTAQIRIDMACPIYAGWPYPALQGVQFEKVGELYEPTQRL